MVGTISLRHMFYTLFGVAFLTPSVAGAVDMASHKAIYNIRLVSVKSGAQVLDVRGKMLYMIKKSCGGYIADHKFNLNYEYAGSPPVQVDTKFASFESKDGRALNFSSTRLSNGEMDQELRGNAKLFPDKQSQAVYTIPDNLSFDLTPKTLFPVAHTLKLIEAAGQGKTFMQATVFDGSDDEGPVEINAFIGKKLKPDEKSALNKDLMQVPGWSMRLAVFPTSGEDQDVSDYEMSMELLENGVVKNMKVDYHDFSVSQDLVAIEPVKSQECGAE